MKLFSKNDNLLERSSPARPGKRFVSLVIDMLIVLFVNTLVFSGIFKITENTNSYEKQIEIINDEIEYYQKFTEDTHIVEYVNDKRVSDEVIVLKNINRAIYLSYSTYGNNQQPDFVFEEGHPVTKEGMASNITDNIAYFYTEYIPNNDFLSKDIIMGNIDPVDYLFNVYRTAFGTDSAFIFTFNKEVANVPVLNTQVAYYLFHYLYIDDSSSIGETGKTYYNSYYNAYTYMLNNAEDSLLNSEPYYSSHYVYYIDAYSKQALYTNISLVISIIISYLICVLLPKYIFKYGRSFGYMIMGLGVLTLDNEDNSWYVTLIKSLVGCVGFIVVSLISYLLEPFNGVYDAMFVPINVDSSVSFGLIILIIGILGALINVFALFSHYRQNALNIIFKDKVVDIHYIDEGDRDDKYEGRPY